MLYYDIKSSIIICSKSSNSSSNFKAVGIDFAIIISRYIYGSLIEGYKWLICYIGACRQTVC